MLYCGGSISIAKSYPQNARMSHMSNSTLGILLKTLKLNTLMSDTRNFKEFEFEDPHSLIWPKLLQAIDVDSMLIIIATKCRQMR